MTKPKILTIIPARMGSSRFPGKPLADILGKSMIEHVYTRCALSEIAGDVYIATCDQVIADHVVSFGGKAVMTADTHERCTDRTAEALLTIEKETGRTFDIVLMVQGDEPLIHPEMIQQALSPFLTQPEVRVVNLANEITETDREDRNEVKLVKSISGKALYFSREPIPCFWTKTNTATAYKQVCVIPFRRDALLEFCELEPTPLEISESVDMLRLLENDIAVHIVETQFQVYSVDTPEDLERVKKIMSDDAVFRSLQ